MYTEKHCTTMKKYFETEWNENNNEFKLVIINNISRNSI